jgi:hypothetical protein
MEFFPPMRTRLSIALALAVALMSFAAATAGATGSASRFTADGFLSPDGTTWCEGAGSEVGCVSFSEGDEEGPGHGAVLKSGGKLTLCQPASAGTGWRCFQNFDDSAPVLGYGRSVKSGAFRCTSSRQGITCVLRSSGKGFRITGDSVARLHP